MDLQNLMPQQAQPISRITSGQLPTKLAELTEAVLGEGANILASSDAEDADLAWGYWNNPVTMGVFINDNFRSEYGVELL